MLQRILQVVLSLPLVFLLVGCTDDDDDFTPPPPDTYLRTITAFDVFNSPVAAFEFTQVTSGSSSTVTCRIRNVRVTPLCVNFQINFQLNAAAWQFNGFVNNLPGGATSNTLVVSSNPARVDLGAFLILFTTDPNIPCGGLLQSSLGGWQGVSEPASASSGCVEDRQWQLQVLPEGIVSGHVAVASNRLGRASGIFAISGSLDPEGRLAAVASGTGGHFEIKGQLAHLAQAENSRQAQLDWTERWPAPHEEDLGPFSALLEGPAAAVESEAQECTVGSLD